MDTFEIDLSLLFSVARKRLIWIILAGLFCASLAFCYAKFYLTPQYRATAKLYVYSDPDRAYMTRSSVTSAELYASQDLVATYLVILESDTVLDQVVEQLDLDISTAQLRGCMSTSIINETEVFSVTVTHPDPEMAQTIANTIADVAPAEIVRVVKAGGVEVVDYARLPTSPSWPSKRRYAMIGCVAGGVLCYGIFLLLALLDTRIRDEEDLERYDLPVLGSIPTFEAIVSGKEYGSGYGSGYGKAYGKTQEAAEAGKGK